MAKASYILRQNRSSYSVRMFLNAGKSHATMTVGITLDGPEQWSPDNPSGPVVNHPCARAYNTLLRARLAQAQEVIANLTLAYGASGITIDMLRTELSRKIDPVKAEAQERQRIAEEQRARSVRVVYYRFMHEHHGRTAELYRETLTRIGQFADLDSLHFEDITVDWIRNFDTHLSATRGVNSRSIDLRNLRAVCHYAWMHDITTTYAWKAYTIRREEGDVDPITPQQFSAIFRADMDPDRIMYRDMALLGFCLIGINLVDLHSLTPDNIRNGYLTYRRAKTGRRYTIRIEPEAEAIISKYRGHDHLLSWADSYKSHKDFMKHQNDALQKIGPYTIKSDKNKRGVTYYYKEYSPIMPQLTWYQFRHTWATFAADLDIPKDIIALCLGHGRKTVTDVYVNYDQRKIDQANRRVIDYALSLIS